MVRGSPLYTQLCFFVTLDNCYITIIDSGRLGEAREGMERFFGSQGCEGLERSGKSWRGQGRLGEVLERLVKAWSWTGRERHGKARKGLKRLGKA